MGGDYYTRQVYSPSVTTKSTKSRKTTANSYSSHANSVLSKTKQLHKSMNPNKKKIISKVENPIVFCIDVTGSMGNWSKIVFDKLPMFYGQIVMQYYLKQPEISFAAVGDAYTDSSPIQVAAFGQGKEIDQLISKMYLEGGGGGQGKESYELMSYYYMSDLCVLDDSCKMPFFFITGDEDFYGQINNKQVGKHLGIDIKGATVSSINCFKDLSKKFKGNVFLLHKAYGGTSQDNRIKKHWKSAIGETNVIVLKDPKAVIDICLGIIALVSGERDLDGYINDMKVRGQSKTRIQQVKVSLNLLSKRTKAKPKNETLLAKQGIRIPEGTKVRTDETGIKIVDAISCGIIPIKYENNECKVLLLKHKEGGHFDFVKGLSKPNEEKKTTAERELKEETQLDIDHYLTDREFKTSYKITKWKGYIINKEVIWYLAAVTGDIKIQKEEVLEYKWVNKEDVINVITYDNGKTLFKDEIMPLL